MLTRVFIYTISIELRPELNYFQLGSGMDIHHPIRPCARKSAVFWIGKVQIELLMVLLLFGAGLSFAAATKKNRCEEMVKG